MTTVVLTGANRGIGLGLATRLARRDGYRIFASARNPDDSEELQQLARETGRVSIHPLNLSDEASIAEFAAHITGAVEYVDLLLHNAGVTGYQTLEELTFGAFADTFSANIFGPAVLTGRLRPTLRAGSLVALMSAQLGSIAGVDGRNGFPYRMSKAALNMFASQLAVQLKPAGIGVVALRPGRVRTRLTRFEGLEIGTSCDGLLDVIDNFTLEQSGEFIGYDGKLVPW